MSEKVLEAIMMTEITWRAVDYMEAVRYVILNLTAEEVMESGLKRILPWRRGKRGNKPGMKGEGPRGATKGDTEQWCFPNVVLSDEEKRLLIATVVSLATKAMFRLHHYKFGGKMFKQMEGGPIGLRGTCSIARLAMQLFDGKWLGRLRSMKVTTELDGRYMDDGRNILAPFKAGWRWSDGRICYTRRWEEEDKGLSSMEITRRIWSGSLEKVEDYLSFTTETCEDFSDWWLPTLDCSLRVDEDNTVLYKFYEKETSSDHTVRRNTAMNEDNKIKVVSNKKAAKYM